MSTLPGAHLPALQQEQLLDQPDSPQPIPLLYQDEHLVVVNKPAGMLVHRSRVADGETRFLLQTLRDQLGQHLFPVHRLDRPTSGAMVLALSSDMASRIAALWHQPSVSKHYLAVVRGYMAEQGELDHPLVPEADKRVAGSANREAQEARSNWQTLAQAELPIAVGPYASARYSLVRLQPLTGRRHQLRRHCAHLRHPIIGDVNHGDNKHNRAMREQLGVPGLLLHSHELQLPHPLTGELLQLRAPVPDRWLPLLERCGWCEHL